MPRERYPIVVPDVTGLSDKEAAHVYLDAGLMPHPWRVKNGTDKASTLRGFKFHELYITHPDIDRWPSSWRCGLTCSQSSGLIAFDVDVPEEFDDWANDIGLSIPRTAQSSTGRDDGKGSHLLFDARSVKSDEWPTQSPVPGGHIKSSGFIAEEPSIHPNGRPYLWQSFYVKPIRPMVSNLLEWQARPQSSNGSSNGRVNPSVLKAECLAAGNGGQRSAVMKYIRELEMRGYDDDDIVTLCMALNLNVYDTRRPWTEKSFIGMLDTPGKIRPDIHLSDDEKAMVDKIGSGNVRLNANGDKALGGIYVDDVKDANIEWLAKPFFPFGSLVIIDGDPGQGKSVLTNLICVNASSGQEILPGLKSIMEPIRCGLVISEDDDSIVRGRLRAAGYSFDRSIMIMNTKNRGKYLKFPEGIMWVKRFIINNELGLLFIDPISQYIGEKIQTHNESSVRDALGPLAEVAKETGCCIVLVRHLNKAGQLKAMYRGGGSIAFSALARSGLITGVLPDKTFGLAQVKCSYARLFEGSMSYSVTEWEDDEEIPVIEWHGNVDSDADTLTQGEKTKKGPEPHSQNAIREVLEQMFQTKHTWPSAEVYDNLRDAGCSTNQKTVDKVRADMGITAHPVHQKGKGFAKWEWTIQPFKNSISNASQYSKDSKDGNDED